jgi:putative MFS transporter
MNRQRAPAASAPPRVRNTWWIPPFLGRVPPLAPTHLRLLGFVALGLFFEQYDLSMITAALKHIARDLDMAESQLGGYLSLVRLGAVPGFVMVALSDHLGRRRLFLAAVVGSGLGTFLTAFSQTPAQFVALQMCTRAFLLAGMAVAFVFVTEEFPAENRGWGVGVLGALGAIGVGFGALLFAAVDVLPYGWRALYVVGLAPLLLLPLFRRAIPETARFLRHREQRGTHLARGGVLLAWTRPFVALVRTYPLRALGIAAAGGLDSVGKAPVFAFTGYYLLQGRGWEPWQYSLMVVVGGGIGIIGNVAAGRLGDVVGRRVVGSTMLALTPAFAWLLYQGPGWGIPLGWVFFVFCATGAMAILRALATELFPTSHRGTAGGWLVLLDTLGSAAGLALVGLVARQPGELAATVSLVALATLLSACVLPLLPETRRRELESISREGGS